MPRLGRVDLRARGPQRSPGAGLCTSEAAAVHAVRSPPCHGYASGGDERKPAWGGVPDGSPRHSDNIEQVRAPKQASRAGGPQGCPMNWGTTPISYAYPGFLVFSGVLKMQNPREIPQIVGLARGFRFLSRNWGEGSTPSFRTRQIRDSRIPNVGNIVVVCTPESIWHESSRSVVFRPPGPRLHTVLPDRGDGTNLSRRKPLSPTAERRIR